MSRISDFAKKPSQSTTSVQPTTSFLQTRDFAPLQMDFDEDTISRSSRNGDNLLEKIINQGSIEPSGTPVQAKPINRLKPLQAKRMATIQAKLSIGELNDKYEQEADATASKVVQQINSPTQDQSVQRQDSMEEEDELQMKPISSIQREASMEEDDELQMKSFVQRRENLGGGEASTDLESSIQSARGSGQSLDHNLQDKIGQAMGADFSDVKIHTDSQSDQLNQSIQSKAFTTGQDVFFRKGTYNPSSKEGQELITHELTHVVQQNGGDVQRLPHIHEKLQHPTSNKTSRLESNSQIQKIKEVPSRLQPKMIQRKGEFKAQFQKNSDIAKAAVKADYASYADYQKNFEIKLGAGLYKNKHAMDGANIMLGKMQVAMIAAGFDEEKVDKAFALSKGEELGGVLLEDVNQAIISGNLREKMGMVYQARFAIAEALNAIRKDPKIPLGEEIQSEEMGKSIEELGREHPSQAILKRRDSVNNQAREGNKDPKQKSITGEYLKELGVPLSEREQKAAKEQLMEKKIGGLYLEVSIIKSTRNKKQKNRINFDE